MNHQADLLQTWLAAVAQVGFPIAITTYLLVRLLPAINRLAATITELTGHVNRCCALGARLAPPGYPNDATRTPILAIPTPPPIQSLIPKPPPAP